MPDHAAILHHQHLRTAISFVEAVERLRAAQTPEDVLATLDIVRV